MADVLRGVVKWFNDPKGFGFIEHTSGKDVFVHYSVIDSEGFKTLKDGEEVLYEVREGPKGLHAVRVQRLGRSISSAGDAESPGENAEAPPDDQEGNAGEEPGIADGNADFSTQTSTDIVS